MVYIQNDNYKNYDFNQILKRMVILGYIFQIWNFYEILIVELFVLKCLNVVKLSFVIILLKY